MPSYTVSKNGYGTVTGSFTWVDSNINVSLKPENLYAWTWRETTTVYTSSSTPSSGDYLYNADGTIYIDDTVNVYDASSNSIYGTPSGDRYYRNLSSDLVWNSNTNQYGLAHGPVGDNLYAYTDPNATGTTSLYAWRTYTGSPVYTSSPTPSMGDPILDENGVQVTYSSSSHIIDEEVGNGYFILKQWHLEKQLTFNRSAADDIISQPATLYTNSTTLTTGMTLYDNTGTDSGLKVRVIHQDGTFEVGQIVSGYRDVLLNDGIFTNIESRQILEEIENLGGFSNISASSLSEMFDGAMELNERPIDSWYIAIADVSASNTEFTFQTIPGGYESWSTQIQGLKLAYVTTDDNYFIIPISLFYTPTYAPTTLFNNSETVNAYTHFANNSVTLDLTDVANILFNIDTLTNDSTNYEFISILDGQQIDIGFDSETGIFTIENIVDNYVMGGTSLDYLNCFLYLTDGTDSILYSDLEGGHYYLDCVQVKCLSFIGL